LQCTRGKVRLLDRPALERQACGCYRLRNGLTMFQRLLV
jgi:hypothetical protein